MTAVARDNRHTKANRCPICDGADGDPRGKSKRCSGFTSSDRTYVHCSREEHAGSIAQNDAGLFAHRMSGPCNCGTSHGADLRAATIGNEIEATYDYTDESGALVFQVVRKTGKRFLQRKPDGAGGWIWKTSDCRRVLYNLPALVANHAKPRHQREIVCIAEGERDVDTLIKRGRIATTNPGGAGKWSFVAQQARELLADTHVTILSDADAPGRAHAHEVAASLRDVAEVTIQEPAPPHKDITALFEAGGNWTHLVPLQEAELQQVDVQPDAPANDDAEVVPTATEPMRGLKFLASVAIIGAKDIRALAARPIQYIWKDIAILGIVVAIAGGPGSGKTTLLFLILAARLNNGARVEVLGREVEPAPAGRYVVLIEGEHGDASACRKLVKSCAVLGVADSALDRIILVARRSVRIGSPEWCDVEKLVKAGLVSDIALDTLARVSAADANDEQAQVAIFDRIAMAIELAPSQETKPVVWVVAHTRKGEATSLDDVSGSTQRTGQADTVLLVNAERREGRVTSSKVVFAKLREEPDEWPLPVEYVVTAAGVVDVDAPIVDERPLEERILERLATLGPQTKNSLRDAMKRSALDVETAISNLFAAHRLSTTIINVKGQERRAFTLREVQL